MTKLTLAAACVTLGLILLATQIVHSAPPQDAENEIREQIVARFAAMEGRRFAAYERFLADSYVSTDDGADKKAVLADVRADHGPGRNTTHGSPSEFHVQFCGSAAVDSYRVLLHETFDAQVLSTDYRKCETYIKQDGAWKHVSLLKNSARSRFYLG